jgi:hypothetical protein
MLTTIVVHGLVGAPLGVIAGGVLGIAAGFIRTMSFHTTGFESRSGMLACFAR